MNVEKTLKDFATPLKHMIYFFQHNERGFSTANRFKAELHIRKESLLFRNFFQTIEEDHLLNSAESNTLQLSLLLALAPLPLKSGKVTPVSRELQTEKSLLNS